MESGEPAAELVGDRILLDQRVKREAAERIAKQGATAVRLAKLVVNSGTRGGADPRDAMEFLAQAVLFESDEKRERMTAFLEAREARRRAREKEKES